MADDPGVECAQMGRCHKRIIPPKARQRKKRRFWHFGDSNLMRGKRGEPGLPERMDSKALTPRSLQQCHMKPAVPEPFLLRPQ